MKILNFAVVVSLALSLASCAPTVMGTQVYSPVIAPKPLARTEVAPGESLYVQYTYAGDDLGIPAARFEAIKIDFRGSSLAGDIVSQEAAAPWLRMKPKNLPAGWNVTLEKATLIKRTTKTQQLNNGTRVYYYEEAQVVYKVTAPADASGEKTFSLQFLDGSDSLGSTDLTLNAQK
jgi:hypothetical protein